MNLSKKKLQELKNKKISIEDLNDRYFINSQYEVEVDNIRKLLNENIYSFQEIADKVKSIDEDDRSGLYRLLKNKELLKELIENNRLNKEDLRYLLNRLDKDYELDHLIENTMLLKYIVDNNLFKELVDKFKSCLKLGSLLANKKFFDTLIQNNRLNTEDLRYLLNRIDDSDEIWGLNINTSLLEYIIENDVFQEVVAEYKKVKELDALLRNKELFEELRLNKDDTRYLLNRIDKFYELDTLCKNTLLIKEILNEFVFVLNKELVDRFNRLLEPDDLHKYTNIHTIFDLIEYENKNNEEILKLNELNKYVCSFDLNEDQRLELFELIQNNEIARNRLIQIVETHLEDQYDFESLKNLLTKDNDRKKNKLNF